MVLGINCGRLGHIPITPLNHDVCVCACLGRHTAHWLQQTSGMCCVVLCACHLTTVVGTMWYNLYRSVATQAQLRGYLHGIAMATLQVALLMAFIIMLFMVLTHHMLYIICKLSKWAKPIPCANCVGGQHHHTKLNCSYSQTNLFKSMN